MALPSNTSRICDSSDDDFVFDFVFVENEFGNGASDDDDADSYDYCEDVCSIISNNNSNSEEEDVLLLADSIVEEDDATSPTTGLKDSVLTVPSVLLKDLDEAHEAAKLTLMTDPEEGNTLNDIVTTCSDDEHGLVDAEEKDNTLSLSSQQPAVVEDSENETSEPSLSTSEPTMSSGNNEDSTGMEDSPSLVPDESPPTVPTESTPTKEIEEVSTTAMATTKPSPLQTFIIMPAAKPGSNTASGAAPCFILANFPKKEGSATTEEKQSSGDTKKIASTSNTGSATKKTSGPVSISRTSNKKRRKKLKLLKKAQAAEKFQQQAALLNMTGGKINKKLIKQSKKQQTPPRSASKKVANIAVSCALETMSSYRKELAVQAKWGVEFWRQAREKVFACSNVLLDGNMNCLPTGHVIWMWPEICGKYQRAFSLSERNGTIASDDEWTYNHHGDESIFRKRTKKQNKKQKTR